MNYKFQTGDIVIKVTGGNKMTIFNIFPDDNHGYCYECVWFIDSFFNKGTFHQDDLVTLEDYKRILKTEERDDKINQILK